MWILIYMIFNINIWRPLELLSIIFALIFMFSLIGVQDPVERAQTRTTITYEVAVAIYAVIKGKEFEENRRKGV